MEMIRNNRIALARPDTILPVVWEITRIKRIILESNREYAKGQLNWFRDLL